ncbi:SIMPL domain-containing protein [Novosphingobium sp.]|uniref:SIMPL domain-containing protein n=1 Tax=Novosphingobium sp. TaxID=1874826 RepID=UPI0025FEA724|nr:SIMPL domain-containing protein [Novosphingobium sp.]MCC6925465.1 SIMPL domain-containing protein [Novosphingobium sp.]
MKSLKFALAPLALALSLPGTAMAHDTQPAIAASSTLLSVSADGKSTRVPDLAVFSAGVVSEGRTASEALAANAAAMNRVLASLKKAGIADKDVQTSNISLNPVYGQPVVGPNGQVTQEPRIVGYQANNTVTVRSRDIKGFGKVLDALVASGANQISGPSFQMSNPSAATDEARVAAMKNARARADLYARAAGLRVVRIVSISEGGGYSPPMPVMYGAKMAMADAAPTPISAGEVEAAVNVSVQFELAP